MLFAAPVLALTAWLLESPTRDELSRVVVESLLAEGLLGMAVAYLVYYILVERAGAWFASLYAFLVPPLGVLMAAAAYGGAPTPRHLLGIAIVLSGLFLVGRGGGAPTAGE
jgi:drug/metabolite transporter (DMT)-like permease